MMKIERKLSCPFCQCDEWETARTDLGFPHFKSDETRPTRMKLMRCKGCGFIPLFAPKEEQK